MDVDLGRLAERADAERDRLLGLLATDCARIDASRPPLELARELVREHPGPEGVIAAAAAHGHDVRRGAWRAGGALVVPHHPTRPVLAAAGARRVAGGLQYDHAARHNRARSRPRALLARPRPPAGTDRGPAHPALGGLRGGLGALCRRTLRRGGVLRG